jgi:hypothetical protein
MINYFTSLELRTVVICMQLRALRRVFLKGQSHEIFDSRFLLNQPHFGHGLKHFCIWLRIHREIRKYK